MSSFELIVWRETETGMETEREWEKTAINNLYRPLLCSMSIHLSSNHLFIRFWYCVYGPCCDFFSFYIKRARIELINRNWPKWVYCFLCAYISRFGRYFNRMCSFCFCSFLPLNWFAYSKRKILYYGMYDNLQEPNYFYKTNSPNLNQALHL